MSTCDYSFLILTHNRLNSLNNTICNINKHSGLLNYEIIVVNNASEDGTKNYLDKLDSKIIRTIHREKNDGVVARNYGLEIAKGKFIVQVDDDVSVLPVWERVMRHFTDDVEAVGVQGFYFDGWSPVIQFKQGVGIGRYCDFLTGYFWIFRNNGWRYDWNYGQFWDEESDLQLQMKAKGCRLKQCETVCSHNCMRDTAKTDWDLHNRNRSYLTNKWKDVPIRFERWNQ